MPNANILITGGTGKVGRRLTTQLRAMGFTPRIATREAKREHEIGFDWSNPATFDAALVEVQAVYLIAPPTGQDLLEAMRPFIDRAVESGVGRFVLQSASSLKEGDPMMGKVHEYLKDAVAHWVVLRPTWFMQNFSEQQHQATIRDESCIYSATGDGKVPFIDVTDIAAVAAQALTDSTFANGDLILTGPALLSYEEVAHTISEILQRPILHRRLAEKEQAAHLKKSGLPPPLAQALAAMDIAISQGSENRTTDNVRAVTGNDPGDFATYAAASVEAWRETVPAGGR